MKKYVVFKDGQYVGEFLEEDDAKWYCDRKNERCGWRCFEYELK